MEIRDFLKKRIFIFIQYFKTFKTICDLGRIILSPVMYTMTYQLKIIFILFYYK